MKSQDQPNAIDLTVLAKQAMRDRHLLPEFSSAVMEEVSVLQNTTTQARDLRNLVWSSIDNDDSKDLDQLTWAESLNDGKSKIRIAVATVSHLVKLHTAIDDHAAHNTTSVYTPSCIFPMLPEKLSTDLTSLNQGEDRNALVFEAILSDIGTIDEYSIFLANVHNHAQLSYDGISDWLDGKADTPKIIENLSGLDKQIRLQDEISRKLSLLHHEQGALSLETIESKAILSDGVVVKLKSTHVSRARKLIENFMIVANTISAKYLESHSIPHLRRVVSVPKRWDKIVEVAFKLGEKLPKNPSSTSLETFLLKQKQKDPLSHPDLSLTIIKLLGKGQYQVAIPGKAVPGHFGLALKDYSHSTAPNRRYPDLITQRMIIAKLNDELFPYDADELIYLAEHCTQKEDDAEKVERRMLKSAAALLLSSMIDQEFKGIITGASEKGTWVRVFDPPVEGKLVRGGLDSDVGDHIKVKLIHADVWNGYIDFEKVN